MALALPEETIARFKEYDRQEAQRRARYGACENPRQEFLEHLLDFGFQNIANIVEGRIVRVMDDQDKGKKKTGWYVYHEFDDSYNDGHVIGCGAFGTWRDDVTHNWMSRGIENMSPAEKLEFQDRRKAAEEIRKKEELQRQHNAAMACFDIYQNATEPDPQHGYFTKKEIQPLGHIRQKDDTLIIPMMNSQNEITSLQYIKPDGSKKYHPGGKVKGALVILPGDNQKIYVVEGYSTGASVHMATGATVYCAFTWSNLYEVTCTAQEQHPSAKIVIAGDDDAFIDRNVGRNKANEICQTLQGVSARFPEFADISDNPTDWNDLHCQEGIEEVTRQLNMEHVPYQPKEDQAAQQMPDHLFNPGGFLGDVVNYYRLTDKRRNDVLALPSSIALASLLLGRNFETNFDNRASLFLMSVARTGAGKEHCDRVIKKILAEEGMDHLANVSGYKSATALFCKFLELPRHLCINNEFSKMLKTTAGKQADSNSSQVIAGMLECSTKLSGIMSPPAYATRGLKEQEKKALAEKVDCPALTFLGTCTPEVYSQISAEMLEDGFLNRFIICISDEPVKYLQFTEKQDVPDRIISWIKTINARIGGNPEIASQAPKCIRLHFTDAAMDIVQEYERKMTDMMNEELHGSPLKNMLPRATEMGMRLSLIKALCDDCYAETIGVEATQWAFDFIDYNQKIVLKTLKRNLANTPHEKKRMEWLAAIRAAGPKGVELRELIKKKPFSGEPKKIRDELIEDLKQSGHIVQDVKKTGKRGKPIGYVYAIEDED
jgi:phage/plasmid primase-like uncharacterized protein